MRPSNPTPTSVLKPFGLTWLTSALRVLLSIIVVWTALSVVQLYWATMVRSRPESHAAETMIRNEKARIMAQTESRTDRRTPWPKYPLAKELGKSRININDIPMASQRLLARAAPKKILSFYRREMRARGWRDNTEEFFMLKPSAIGNSTYTRNLQDERYLRRYENIKKSKLSLVRNNESILVEVYPKKAHQTVIELHSARAPSVLSLLQKISAQAGDHVRGTRPFLESRTMPGQPSASSRIYRSKHSAHSFFPQMVRTLEQEGWKYSKEGRDPNRTRNMEPGAMFTRGDQTASLTVSPGDNNGSVAIVIQTQ